MARAKYAIIKHSELPVSGLIKENLKMLTQKLLITEIISKITRTSRYKKSTIKLSSNKTHKNKKT